MEKWREKGKMQIGSAILLREHVSLGYIQAHCYIIQCTI